MATKPVIPDEDLLARLGANVFRKTHETGRSAKEEIRKVLGTYDKDGMLPAWTIAELSKLTKKSEVNLRTMLSDLRSTAYCGKKGVFLTERIRRPDGQFAFRYCPPAAYGQAVMLDKQVNGLNVEALGHDGRGGKFPAEQPWEPAGVRPDFDPLDGMTRDPARIGNAELCAEMLRLPLVIPPVEVLPDTAISGEMAEQFIEHLAKSADS